MSAAMERVHAARVKLVLDQPFFGALALRLALREDPGCGTGWVDGTTLGFDPEWIDSLSDPQVVGFVVHEVMHCAAGHPWRRDAREPQRFNAACDYAINPVIADDGFELPPNGLLDDDYRGKNAEWIYDRLPEPEPEEPEPEDGAGEGEGEGDGPEGSEEENDEQAGSEAGAAGESGDGEDADGDTEGSGGGDAADDEPAEGTAGKPGKGSKRQRPARTEVRDAPSGEPAPGEPEPVSEQDWQAAVREAATVAEGMGTMPGATERFAADAAQNKNDWRSYLHRFVRELANADYTFRTPNKRYVAQGYYLPALRADELGTVVIAIDTSGSIDDVALGQMEQAVRGAIDEAQPRRVVVMYCDTRVHRTETFERGEPFTLHAVGRGGTDFRPVFEAVEQLEEAPACLIYLTDLEGCFPAREPDYPVLWAATVGSCRDYYRPVAPWGETVYME